MASNQIATRRNWTREELIAAFNLYCQLPFGKLDKSNPQIIQLALLINRTPSAVAFKLVNFASLDPVITMSGRVGMTNVSALDRAIWAEFNANWEDLATESQAVIERLAKDKGEELPFSDLDTENTKEIPPSLLIGRSRSALVQVRVNQSFFRRAVLANYQGRCCMTGLNHPRLLVASHIVPWSVDVANRLNPHNGLCLSALHDKAFDIGLISLSDDYTVLVSKKLRHKADEFTQSALISLQGKSVAIPKKFLPEHAFLLHHRNTIYLGD